MSKPKTLKSKLTKSILLVSLTPMITATIVLLVFLIRYVYLNNIADQTKRVDYVESNMTLIFEEMESIINEINLNLQSNIIDEVDINNYFDIIIGNHLIFDSIRRIDINGNIINAPKKEADIIGFNISYEGYYMDGLQAPGMKWSKNFLSPYTSEISIAISIHNSDGTMIVGYCSLLEIQKLVASILLEGDEDVAIVDQLGSYIAHNDFDKVKQREIDEHYKKLNDGNGKIMLLEYGSIKHLVMSRELPDQKLTIISYFDYYETYKIIGQVLMLSLSCIVFILLMSLLIAKIQSQPIINEINGIISKTGEISSGRYGTTLERSSLFELDELSTNFNKMILTIQESFIQLSDSQAELEILNEELMAQNEEISQSERQISTILNNIYDGIMMIDEKRNIKWINDKVFELFNLDQTDAIKVRKCHKCLYHSNVKCTNCEMDEIQQINQKKTVVLSLNNKQIEMTYIPIYDQNQFAGMIKTFRDITEKVELENKFNAAIKMEAIGRLTGGIAHDFNNILQIIIGYSELVMAQMGDTNILYPKMETIFDAASKAERLIKQLMTFSKIDQTNPVNLNLNSVVKEIGAMLTNVLGHHIELELLLDESLSEVFADRVQMEQVIMNLCMNAKHAMQNGGKLSIETYNKVDDLGSFCVLQITDTGTGIPEQIREKIFDPFFTTKEFGKGTGLGLAIVLRIIEKHHGLVELKTQVGEGTRFTILLPPTSTSAKASIQVDEKMDCLPLKGLKVLLAEDEDAIRTIAATALIDHGVTVVEARNGREAVLKYKAHEECFDLLILDVIMPEMNGVETYEVIKKQQPNIKVIFTTGYSSDFLGEDYNLSLQGKILQKPYKLRILMKMILEVLEL